jgi:hypothetical protein
LQFLAGLAAERRQRGVAASTVNIGAIMGNGYVTRELTLSQQLALQKVGNMWMSEQDFFTIFGEAVIASPPVPGPNPEYSTGLRIYYADEDDKPKFANDPVFSHLMLHRNVAGATKIGGTALASVRSQLVGATTPEEVLEILTGKFYGLMDQFRAILKLTYGSVSFCKTTSSVANLAGYRCLWSDGRRVGHRFIGRCRLAVMVPEGTRR